MESFAPDLLNAPRTPLQPDHVSALRKYGEEVEYSAGELVIDTGECMDAFLYVLEGGLEPLDPFTKEPFSTTHIGPGQFGGELALIYGGRATLPMRAKGPSRFLSVSREDLLQLMPQVPEMGDIIVSVYSWRRRRAIEVDGTGITIIGASERPNLARIETFAHRSRIPCTSLELGSPEAEKLLADCGSLEMAPMVLLGKEQVLENPTPKTVARELGLDLKLSDNAEYDVLIVGGGPGGVAAGVYAGAEGLSALVVDELAIGGQAATSSRIENYMGFPTGISGSDLVWRGQVQAMKFGTEFAMPTKVVGITRDGDSCFAAELDDGKKVRARTVVVATGVQYRRLPIDELERYEGVGIYYAATEIEARRIHGTEVVVIGGGNSAGQAAMFLCRHAEHVHLLVRGNSLASSMSEYLSSRLEADPKVTIHFGTQAEALSGTGRLEQVGCHQAGEDRQWTIDAKGLFIMVGAAPNSAWLPPSVLSDPNGFILTGDAVGAEYSFETAEKGIFAVGDVRASSVKRVASAVGEGSVVISQVWNRVRGS